MSGFCKSGSKDKLCIKLYVYSHIMKMYISLLDTKEAAFVYALASAAVVHTVAEKCAKGNGLPYCGCLNNEDLEDLPAGERWVGCSPDINFGLSFAEKFLDSRESSAPLKHKAFALHNNRIGRKVCS